MAKYTGPACRQCRREGVKLFAKGERCFTDKCAMNRRTGVPGQHGAARKKVSEYGLQLREVQKCKRYYGIPERQFRNYFKIADAKEGMTGENLLTLIERRLDNIVFRMGMGESRRDARQLVTHGHFEVNGKKADIASMILRVSDVVSIKATSRKSEKIKSLIENLDNRQMPAWLDVDKTNVTATVTALPKREDVDFPFEEHFIVEWYSKKA